MKRKKRQNRRFKGIRLGVKVESPSLPQLPKSWDSTSKGELSFSTKKYRAKFGTILFHFRLPFPTLQFSFLHTSLREDPGGGLLHLPSGRRGRAPRGGENFSPHPPRPFLILFGKIFIFVF